MGEFMNIIIEAILQNLIYTGCGIIIFIISYVSNMCFSIYYNTRVLNEEFEPKRIKESVIKILLFGLGTVLLCVGVTTIPIFCDYVGLEIPEVYTEVFETLAILSVFIYASFKYLSEAYGKFKKLLEGNNYD